MAAVWAAIPPPMMMTSRTSVMRVTVGWFVYKHIVGLFFLCAKPASPLVGRSFSSFAGPLAWRFIFFPFVIAAVEADEKVEMLVPFDVDVVASASQAGARRFRLCLV